MYGHLPSVVEPVFIDQANDVTEHQGLSLQAKNAKEKLEITLCRSQQMVDQKRKTM